MGNTISEQVLSAAAKGDVAVLNDRISNVAFRKYILVARTGILAGRKNLLHVACKASSAVVACILQPLVNAVTTEITEGCYPGLATELLDNVINQQDSRGR